MPKASKLQLNKEQKRAVLHKNGPILVIAGAGTGKTRVITERIRRLLKDNKHNSQEILALTFTDKAAREMSERVGDIMPLGYEEPWINTFHAFCDKILRMEGIEIGLDPSYKILSGPDQWLLFRKNIFDFNLKYFLPMGNPTKFISAILKFISRMQDENISAADFSKFAANFQGDEKDKERWYELTNIYKNYQDLKIQNSKLDFGDLISWTIQLFEKRSNILKKYQQQFKHVLVDEFQDTNYAQFELIKKLCPSDLGERSLLVVGDDSQSIYKFRGAAVSNILKFMNDYPEAEMITLTKNYRSTQNILDPAYKLIQNNNPDTLESKLKISKKLVSENPAKEIPVEILQTETVEDEVEMVMAKIYKILAKEPSYTYRDIAILARAHSHLDMFVLALRKHGMPYQLVGNRGLYDQDEVRNLLALLKIIINPKDSINLYRALNIDSLDIPQEQITNLLSQSKYKKQGIWELMQEAQSGQLREMVKLIRKYQNNITKLLPVQFVYNLVNESGYLSLFLEEETIENKLGIKNLDLFLNKVKRFEIDYRSENKELPTIIDFVDHIDLLIEAGDNPAQAEIEDVDTINLLTVHSAKGLEFPVVFLVNLVAGRFPTRNRSDVIEVPDALVKETLPSGDAHLQEERRLLYVGMTRAEKYLYMTLSKNYGGVRERKPSGYLLETGLKIKEVKQEGIADKTKGQKALFGVNSKFRDPIYSQTDFIPKFLSYSQIDTYKICPLKYKYSYVLRVPSMPSYALSFGITIHDTLRDFHSKKMFEDVSLDELLKIYENNWHPLGYLDEKHRNIRFENGKQLLETYYKKQQKENVKPLALEKSFNIRVGGIKFYGRIDRIDPLNGGVEIIDYKTGRAKTQKEVDKDAQVAFYAIAAKEAFNMEPKKLTYHFLESDEKVSTTRNNAELENIKEEVGKVVEKIKEGDFTPRSGMHCNWCDYQDICPFAYKG